MNDIKHLIEIIKLNNGSASIDEMCEYFVEDQHILISSFHKDVMLKVLLFNSSLVRLNTATLKWELGANASEDSYLYVKDNKLFRTIRIAMKAIFNKSVQSQGAYFTVDENYDAWFPQNGNKDWSNTLSEDGKTWIEKPSHEDNYDTPNGKFRYSFLKTKEGYKFVGVFVFDHMDGNARIYKIVDDKVKIMGSKAVAKNLIICNIGYMKYYNGVTEEDGFQGGGGKYTIENNDGGEKYNFCPREDGKIYGFVETNYTDQENHLGEAAFAKNIIIEKINPIFKDKDTAEDVRVVFISKGPNNDKNVVVGWYENATVYRVRQEFEGAFGYNIVCDVENAHLLVEEDRTFKYPKKNDDGTFNFGQSNVSYPYSSGQESTIKLANELNKYIDDKLFLEEDSIHFFYEPVNLNQWPMFEKVSGVGHQEYFLATKKMKQGDYIIPHVGSQVNSVQSGVYGVAKIISNPDILKNHDGDYCNGKLSVLTEFVSFGSECIIKNTDFAKYINNQFRTAHVIDAKHNEELAALFGLGL